MKNIVISVENQKESVEVQKKLFSKRVFWASGARFPIFTDKKFLCVDNLNTKKKAITFRIRLPNHVEYSRLHEHKFITAESFLAT